MTNHDENVSDREAKETFSAFAQQYETGQHIRLRFNFYHAVDIETVNVTFCNVDEPSGSLILSGKPSLLRDDTRITGNHVLMVSEQDLKAAGINPKRYSVVVSCTVPHNTPTGEYQCVVPPVCLGANGAPVGVFREKLDPFWVLATSG